MNHPLKNQFILLHSVLSSAKGHDTTKGASHNELNIYQINNDKNYQQNNHFTKDNVFDDFNDSKISFSEEDDFENEWRDEDDGVREGVRGGVKERVKEGVREGGQKREENHLDSIYGNSTEWY